MVKRCSFTVVAIILLLLILPFDATYADGTTVQVAPSVSMVGEGTTFAVDVTVVGVADLAVWEFRLFYLSSVLNCTGAVKGPFLENGGGTQFFTFAVYNAYNATHGCLLFGASLIGAVPGVNGSGTLATITFQAKAAGDTSLHFDDDPTWSFLKDSAPPPRHIIPYATIDGIVHVQNFALTVSTVGNGSVGLNDTGPYYYYGEAVQLTATPAVGWRFDNWSGNLVGSATPAMLIMTGNMSVTATFVQMNYTLTISIQGNGTVNLTDTGPYYYGDAVLLTPIPSSYWNFDHWSGDLTGSANPATLIVTGNMSVTATFVQMYTLTISIQGNGTVNLNYTGPYHYGDAVLLTAVPDAHWVFNYWSGNLVGTSSIATLVITGNMIATAWFSQNVYTLTVNIIGSGSVIQNNTGPYHYGDVVQVTANASVGYNFRNWSGDLTGSANPTTILIDGNKIINANFTLNQYTLTVNVVGSGSVTLNPNATYYYYGIQVQLTAVGSTGWGFDHWSGDLIGSLSPCPLVMIRNMSVTATFVQINYTLIVHTIGHGAVSLNSTPPYHYGDVVLMIAVPNAGYSFEQWTGDLNSGNPATLIITRNMDITAWFLQNVYTLTVNVVGTGNVTMNSTGPYYYGDAVLLTAISSTPWIFDHWTGGLMGSTNPATLVITANVSVTAYFIVGEPTLFMSPNNITCRVFDENFTVTVTVFDAVNVKDFAFEIHYNTTLLDYTNITWNAWGAGTVIVDEVAGNITGSTSGNPLNGRQTLIMIEFETAYHHVWKSDPHWTNDLTAFIFFQWANLSYPSGPDLRYERGGLNQIYIGPDFVYRFSPIQGDVNGDGVVDSFDLRSVAAFYGAKEGDQNWTQAATYDLNGDGTIGITDLDLVAGNYGFTYTR